MKLDAETIETALVISAIIGGWNWLRKLRKDMDAMFIKLRDLEKRGKS